MSQMNPFMEFPQSDAGNIIINISNIAAIVDTDTGSCTIHTSGGTFEVIMPREDVIREIEKLLKGKE
jgi:hypothetical protein